MIDSNKFVHDYTLKELQEIPIIPFETEEITEIVLVPFRVCAECEEYDIIKPIFCRCGKVLGAGECTDLISLLYFPFIKANRIDCLTKSKCIRLLINRHEVYYGI